MSDIDAVLLVLPEVNATYPNICFRYPGVPHGFSGFAPHIKAGIKWKADLNEGIRWLLSLSQSNA